MDQTQSGSGGANPANLPAVITSAVKKRGDLIKAENFTPEQIAHSEEIAKAINFDDTNTILTFGAAPQREINSFLDNLLTDIKVGDAGVAGTITLELSEGYDLMRIEEIKKQLTGDGGSGFWSGIGKVIGVVTDLAGLIKNMSDQKSTIIAKFDKIERIANDRKRELMNYNVRLDQLQKGSERFIFDMAVHIAAGEKALLRGVDEYDGRLAKTQSGAADDMEPARLHDLARRIASFEQRLLRMKIAYTQAITVTNPRIQAIRQAGEIEVQNILEAMLFDVPNLKSLVLQVAAMTNIKQAQEEDEKRREVSAKIAGAAAEMFDEVYTTSLASQGRGLDDVRALAQTADKLIETLRKGEAIEQENKRKRAEAADALIDVKDKVQAALTDLRPDLK